MTRSAIMLAFAATVAAPASALSAADLSGAWALTGEDRAAVIADCALPMRLTASGGTIDLSAPGWTARFTLVDRGETAALLKPIAGAGVGYLVTRQPDGSLRMEETSADGRTRPRVAAVIARRCL
jgi:hypothetical protein